MKNIFLHLFIFIVFLLGACSSGEVANKAPESALIALGYVTSWSEVMPDPAHLTHINYAFGHVNETFDGIRIDNEDRLRTIIELKKQKPSLKILLSVGGWGSGGFSEMAAVGKNRQSFAADCKRVVDQFGLDGIDLDWEYPTHSWGGIASSPEDYGNYTLLTIDIRKAIGNEKLLTMATLADADPIIDYETLVHYKDFFNIMTYDLAMLSATAPPGHHAGLYRSEFTNRISVEEAVDKHVAAGIPIDKLVLGIPFYGRGQRINISELPEGYTIHWDDVAKASYVTNAEGVFVYTYECMHSIEYKCEFIMKRGMLGAMYWSYGNKEFSDAVYNGLMNDKK